MDDRAFDGEGEERREGMREGRRGALTLTGAVMVLVILAWGVIGRASNDRAGAAASKAVPLTIQVEDSTDPLFVPGTKTGWTTILSATATFKTGQDLLLQGVVSYKNDGPVTAGVTYQVLMDGWPEGVTYGDSSGAGLADTSAVSIQCNDMTAGIHQIEIQAAVAQDVSGSVAFLGRSMNLIQFGIFHPPM
jgi:hypothetical protein